ncbi:peptidase S74, partial [Candidatus Acetothermia bacterium]|nr:peptidase S74 [Candidatus Acetothermia bacterium]
VLHQLSLIPITEWNYKAQAAQIRHIGPMAQDFYAAFGLGESDKTISTIDADGIALISIQALYELSLEKDKQIEELKASNDELTKRVEKLEKLVQELSKK